MDMNSIPSMEQDRMVGMSGKEADLPLGAVVPTGDMVVYADLDSG